MAEIALDRLASKLDEVLDEARNMRSELPAMRAEIYGGFHICAAPTSAWMALDVSSRDMDGALRRRR